MTELAYLIHFKDGNPKRSKKAVKDKAGDLGGQSQTSDDETDTGLIDMLMFDISDGIYQQPQWEECYQKLWRITFNRASRCSLIWRGLIKLSNNAM